MCYVTSGVTQGSLLASLFFVIYVNDLPESCPAVIPLLFADDAKFKSVNKSNLIGQLNLTRVMKWSEKHELSFYLEKFSHILMFNCTHHHSFSGILIEKIHVQKDLGIYVTSDLRWDILIKKSANKALEVLFQAKEKLTTPNSVS